MYITVSDHQEGVRISCKNIDGFNSVIVIYLSLVSINQEIFFKFSKYRSPVIS